MVTPYTHGLITLFVVAIVAGGFLYLRKGLLEYVLCIGAALLAFSAVYGFLAAFSNHGSSLMIAEAVGAFAGVTAANAYMQHRMGLDEPDADESASESEADQAAEDSEVEPAGVA